MSILLNIKKVTIFIKFKNYMKLITIIGFFP